MSKAREVSRSIKEEVERELWGRAAARCEFNGCNKLLYKHRLTEEPVNLAEMAHVYSFSEKGPRGWGPFKVDRAGINDLANLLLALITVMQSHNQSRFARQQAAQDQAMRADTDEQHVRYQQRLLTALEALTNHAPPSPMHHVIGPRPANVRSAAAGGCRGQNAVRLRLERARHRGRFGERANYSRP